MSNIKHVTIVLSDPTADRVTEALDATYETIHRAARLWCADRRPPTIDAPSIAQDEPVASRFSYYSK